MFKLTYGGKFLLRAAVVAAFISVLLLAIPGCRKEEHQSYRFLMDSKAGIAIKDPVASEEAERIMEKAFDRMEELEKQLDRGTEGSDLWRINREAGNEPVEVENETFKLIEKGMEMGEKTGGAFDITIAPVVDLWGFYDLQQEAASVPSPEEIEKKLPLVDYSLIELDRQNKEVFLPKEGMKIELGGIAKGYIVDEAARVLQEEGIQHAMVSGGGDIRLLGDKNPEGDPWTIGITRPGETGGHLARLLLSDVGIDTSGDYERVFEEEGEYYHHLLDPDTGYPAEDLSSVTAVSSDTMKADVISTAVFVLGAEKGMELLEDLEDTEGVIFTKEEELMYTPGLEDRIKK